MWVLIILQNVCLFYIVSWIEKHSFFLLSNFCLILEILIIWMQEILEAREKEKVHIWSFRTPEEAASNWEELFGHLNEVE